MALFKVLTLLCLVTICESQEQGDIRLYRGSSASGVVQVYNSGTWKTLCSTNFGKKEAQVVCLSLNYSNGTSLDETAFGQLENVDTYPNVLSSTGCQSGTVNGILNCDFESGKVCVDGDKRYASVNCFSTKESITDYSVKLSDEGMAESGYFSTVLVYKHNIWGHVCGQFWDDSDAQVICRQLGFLGGVASYSGSDWSLPVVVLNTGCTGNENNFTECDLGVGVECQTDRVADVVCYKTQKPRLQLAGGKAHYGHVVFSIDGMQGLLCPAQPTWSYKEAYTVCKTMGYTSGFVFQGTEKEALMSAGTEDIFIEGLSCDGDEDSIFQCKSAGWKNLTGYCNDISKAAAVYCYTTVRLATSIIERINVHLGRVELFDNGSWRPVCADTFSQTHADMVCQQFNFSRAEIALPGNFGNGYYRTTPVNSLSCDGSETSLVNCSYTVGRCQNYNEHSALVCTQDNVPNDYNVTLSDVFHGYVQIERYGVKGHVCREGWDDNDAAVLCRSLNFVTGFMFGNPFDYSRLTPVWVTNFTCSRGEDSLTQCGFQSNLGKDWSCAQDLSPAGVLCFSGKPPEIKVGSRGSDDSPHTFRAEIYHDSIGWSSICNFDWTNLDAKVYCRELGYPNGQIASNGFVKGDVGQQIAMSGLECDGTETSIFQCPNNGWRKISSSCDHSKDAGVACYSWIKMEPTKSFGAVLYHSGENYGLVCADNFDDKAATAVCQEQAPFSFPYGKAICCSAAGPQNLNFTLSDVSCSTGAKSLRECTYNDMNPFCSSGKYAAVACSDQNTAFTKLVADPLVKVTYFSQEGYICSEMFSDADADVVCSQLGFRYAAKFKASATDIYYKIRWLNGFGCTGQEIFTDQCNMMWGNIRTCSWDSVAAARCSDNQDDLQFDIRIVNGSTVSGRVELKIDNQWGTLCGNDLTKNEATVICHQLGYNGGIAMQPGLFGAGTGPVHLSGFQCEGNEANITDCIWTGYKGVSSFCDHSKDAAVKCFDNIQLTGSTTVNYGRLEVFDATEGGWVAVCDNSIFTNEAQLICRQLGYADGLIQRGSPLGPTNTNIVITDVDCSNIAKCTFSRGECSTGRYAAVYCSDSPIANENGMIRLPLTSYYGPLSTRRYGLWGHICSVGFDDNDAIVVCGQLGYQSGQAIYTYKTPGFPIIQGNVACDGAEDSLGDCNRSPFVSDPGCYDVETVAGVMCYDAPGISLSSTVLDTNTGSMSIVAGIEMNSKKLRFAYSSFTDKDAAVYCKALDFAGGEVYRSQQGGYGVSGIQCEGTEESILQCPGTWDPMENGNQIGDLAGVICYTAVRLVSGDPSFYGVVYTTKGVNSGPVCSAGFDVADAGVACSSLNYDAGIVLCCSPFGRIVDQAVITNVQCTGSEKHLTDCLHDEVTVSSVEACQKNYAAVVCYNYPKGDDYTIRLSGITENTGHVIITYLGIDGTICMDGWDDDSASVACKQIGYRRGVAYTAARSSISPGPFWTSNVQCTGSEDQLSDCQWTKIGSVSQCTSSNSQAGVICFDNEGIFYQLGGTGELRYGRVELSINGEWRSICNLFWDQEESHVLCKMLGYSTGDVYSGATNGSLTGPVWEVNYQCAGSETNLNLCVSTGWRVSTQATCAQHNNDAGTFCYKSVKLSTGVGRETDQGGVLLYRNDQWYSTCCDGFDDKSAAVVCQELGFADGQALSCSFFGASIDFPLLRTHKIGCNGDETDVSDCLVEQSCQGNQYASVVCYSFLNTTEPLPAKKKEAFDSRPVIIAVVLFVVLLAIAIIVAVCVIRYRRRKKIEKSKENFGERIVEENNDGTIIVTNRLTGLVSTPNPPRVQYNRNRHDDEGEVSYHNAGYNGLSPHDNNGYSHIYDNTDPSKSTEDDHDYDKIPVHNTDTESLDVSRKPQTDSEKSGPGTSKTVINIKTGQSALNFDNHVFSNNAGKDDHVYDNPKPQDRNRLSLSQQDEVQVSKDSIEKD